MSTDVLPLRTYASHPSVARKSFPSGVRTVARTRNSVRPSTARPVVGASRCDASHDRGEGKDDQQKRALHAVTIHSRIRRWDSPPLTTSPLGVVETTLRADPNAVNRNAVNRIPRRSRARRAECRGHPWPPGPPEVGGSLRPAPVLPSVSYPPLVQRAAGREVGSNRMRHRVVAHCHHEAAAAPATSVYPPLDAGSSPLVPFGMFRVADCV